MEKVIAACGNDCASCPRYVKHPYEKTGDELHRTAVLWKEIGYRDRVETNEEIACTGCKPENRCRYGAAKCCGNRNLKTCKDCPEYPCENMRACFDVTRSFENRCRQVCTDEEWEKIRRAFFEKEKNLA